MIVTHKVSMDLLKPGIQPQIDVVQDDQFTRKIAIALYTNGIAWEIPVDAAAMIRYRKSDGKGGQYDTLPDGTCAWAIEKNVLTIALAPQVMTAAGQVQLSATLVLDAQVLSTFALVLNVRRGIRAETADSTHYFNVTGFLPIPEQAEAGQYLQVSAVDGNGKVTGVEAVDMPACTTVEGSGIEDNLHAILNSWNGKIWYVLGDSISAEASITAGHTKKLYHTYVKEYLGFGKVVNLARSGHSIGQNSTASSNNVMWQMEKIGSDADLITIFAGVNDRWFNVPLGEPEDTDVTTVYGALNSICIYLVTNFPGKQLLFITPTKEDNAKCASDNTTGVTVEQIAEAVRERCAVYAIDCLDAHARSGIYPLVMTNAGTFTSDRLHLNTNGHKRLAQLLTGHLLGKGSYQYTVPAEMVTLNMDHMTFVNSSASYQTVAATVYPENTTEILSYSSSNTSVATVNYYGAVTPQGAGTCVIKATCGSVYAECVVTVGDDNSGTMAVESVVLNKSIGTLTVGENEQLTATVSPSNATDQTVSWKSSDESVVRVTDGLVTAVGAGTATVTAAAQSNTAAAASCTYTVSAAEEEDDTVAVTGVTLSASSATLTVGDTAQLTAAVSPDNATDQSLTWTSSDQSVATVVDGLVTAVGGGSATITATAHNGISASCTYTVEEQEEPFDANNYIGKTYTMTGVEWANQFHAAMLLDGSGAAVGDTVTVKLSVSNLTNAACSTLPYWGYDYGTAAKLGEGSTGSYVLSAGSSIAESDGISTVTQTAALNSYTDGNHIQVMFKFTTDSLPASFKIESIEASLPILDFGSYKAGETFEIS